MEIPPDAKDVSIPLTKIITSGTILSLLMLVTGILPYLVHWGLPRLLDEAFSLRVLPITVFALFAGLILHEAVHAIGWKYAGNVAWNALSFGIDRKTLSPYTHLNTPITARAYRIGAALPGFVTGVVPALYGGFTGDAVMAAVGAVLFSGAVGDAIVLWVIRDVPPHARVLDHPSNAGCYVLQDSSEF